MERTRQGAQQKVLGVLFLPGLEKERPLVETVDLLTGKLFEGPVHRLFSRRNGKAPWLRPHLEYIQTGKGSR